MGKFCTQCGKPLEEGVPCSCQETAGASTYSAPQASNSAPQPGNASAAGGSDFVGFCKSMLSFSTEFMKKPAELVKNAAVTENFKAGIFFMIAQAVAIAFFIMAIIKNANSVSSGVSDFFFSFLGFGDRYGKVSYFTVFLKVGFFEAAQCVVLAALLYFVARYLYKGTGSFKAVFAVVAVATIPMSFSILVGIVFVFVYWKIAAFLVLFGALTTFTLTAAGMEKAMKMDGNKYAYVVSIAYTLYYLAIILFLYYMAKSIQNHAVNRVNGVFDNMDELKNLNDLFGN